MPLDQNRLKNKFKAVLDQTSAEDENPEESKELLASELAKAIVEEIKELQILYTTGLVAPTGPVTGTLANVEIL